MGLRPESITLDEGSNSRRRVTRADRLESRTSTLQVVLQKLFFIKKDDEQDK